MERLPNEILENAIGVYEITVDVVGDNDEYENSALDRATYNFLKELKTYRDAEKQGLLLRLPCKVGDTVYTIMIVGLEFGTLKYQVYEAKVCRHHVDSLHLCVEMMIAENGQIIELVAETFGETVFLTREEAEAALEKTKGE